MSIKASTKSGGDFEKELVPAGNHVARLYSIIHIGKIEEEYMGEAKINDKVMLRFELPDEMRTYGDKGELPMAINREYTLSLGEKANLRKLVEGMLGSTLNDSDEFFGVESLVGKVCLLNVIHKTTQKGKVYAQIVAASPLPKSMKAPEAINAPFIFDYEENFSQEEVEKMPQFIQDKIKSSEQYKNRTTGGQSHVDAIETALNEVTGEDIPFN